MVLDDEPYSNPLERRRGRLLRGEGWRLARAQVRSQLLAHIHGRVLTFNCPNHLFCRLLIKSIQVVITRTYKSDGYGSQG